jgi:hypothetical protein
VRELMLPAAPIDDYLLPMALVVAVLQGINILKHIKKTVLNTVDLKLSNYLKPRK